MARSEPAFERGMPVNWHQFSALTLESVKGNGLRRVESSPSTNGLIGSAERGFQVADKSQPNYGPNPGL